MRASVLLPQGQRPGLGELSPPGAVTEGVLSGRLLEIQKAPRSAVGTPSTIAARWSPSPMGGGVLNEMFSCR